MTNHSHSGSHSRGGWEQQLQAAERQYSDFFPDMVLPVPPDSQSQSQSQSQPSAFPSQEEVGAALAATAAVDTSTLFQEDAFMSAVLSLGIVALDRKDLIASGLHQTQLDAGRRYSQASIGQMNGLDQLEVAFDQLVEQVSSLKTVLLTPQFFPQSALDRYKGQLAQWGGDLDRLQFEGVDAVPTQPVTSGGEPVRARRKSLNRRCLHLRDEIDESIEVLEAVQQLQDSERARRADPSFSSELGGGLLYDDNGFLLRPGHKHDGEGEERDEEVDDSYHETMRNPLLDGLDQQVDWAAMITLQRRLTVTPLATRYAQAMQAANLPLCDTVYEYLQDPPSHAHCLALTHHPLAPTELPALLRVLTSSKKLRTELRKLVLHDCELGDQDCTVLAQYLPQLPGLAALALKQNNITNEGAAGIMQSLASCNGLRLESLALDGNLIEAAGVVEDLGAFFLLRGLLNKKRRAIRQLPLPPGQEELVLDLVRDFDLDFFQEGDEGASQDTPTTATTEPASEETHGTPSTTGLQEEMHREEKQELEGARKGHLVSPFSSSNFSFDDDISSMGGESVLQQQQQQQQQQLQQQQLQLPGGGGYARGEGRVVSQNSRHAQHHELEEDGGAEEEKVGGEGALQAKAWAMKKWQRLKLKLMAVAAFRALGQRGSRLHTLKLEQCGLGPASAHMLAHALRDNNYITDILLSHNQNLLATPAATKAFADLLASSDNRIRVLGLKNTGVGDESVRQLVLGVTHANCRHLAELDVSDGSLGSLGAAWLAGCTRDMFFDQLSVSSVPSKSYAIDLL